MHLKNTTLGIKYFFDLPCHWQQRPTSASTFLASFEQLEACKLPPILPAHTESIKIPVGEG